MAKARNSGEFSVVSIAVNLFGLFQKTFFKDSLKSLSSRYL